MNFLKAALSTGKRVRSCGLSSLGLFLSQPAILWPVAAVYTWAGGRWRGHSPSPGISRGILVVESIAWSYEKEERECQDAERKKRFFKRFYFIFLRGLQERQDLGCAEASRAVALHRGHRSCLDLSRTLQT